MMRGGHQTRMAGRVRPQQGRGGFRGFMQDRVGSRGGRRPASFGLPQKQPPPQRDFFAELNAFQDPNIGGQQPGPISAGYGGFGALDTMSQTKMNDYLNTLSVGGDRERAMNALGYNNAGNPYTPQVAQGTNRFYRGNARENQLTGGYSAPGIYQHQDPLGNYVGVTNVGQDLSAQYTPFDINARGGRVRTRRTRTFGDVMY